MSTTTYTPARAVVPVGVLERAALACDEHADEIIQRSHTDANIQREEALREIARGLYAAARGELVDWGTDPVPARHPDDGDDWPIASLANMRHAATLPDPRAVVAWDAETGETCSADPRDYFAMADADVLEHDGRPMYLARAERPTGRRMVPAFGDSNAADLTDAAALHAIFDLLDASDDWNSDEWNEINQIFERAGYTFRQHDEVIVCAKCGNELEDGNETANGWRLRSTSKSTDGHALELFERQAPHVRRLIAEGADLGTLARRYPDHFDAETPECFPCQGAPTL